jgi:hypothetical protein
MSRALNIDATVAEVTAMSANHSVQISAIEPLQPSGTRVVFMNMEGAATIARVYGERVLTGPVTRMPWASSRGA